MKGLIICVGLEGEPHPSTYPSSRHMTLIGNKPMVAYIIDSYIKADITDIGIVMDEDEGSIRSLTNGVEYKNVKFEFIKQGNPLGLADAITSSHEFIKDDDFIVVLGNNFFDVDISTIVDNFYKFKCNCHINLKKVKELQNHSIACILDGKIIDLLDKPRSSCTNMAITGIYVFDKNIFEACVNTKPSWRGEYEIIDSLRWLIDNGYDVSYEVLNDWWIDVRCSEDIILANQHFLMNIDTKIKGLIDEKSKIAGNVILGENSKVYDSIIRGPVCIGNDTIIENSYIGPYTSIGNKDRILNSQIENSVIFDECFISNIKLAIDNSIINKNSHVLCKKASKKNSISLNLGINSKVIIS